MELLTIVYNQKKEQHEKGRKNEKSNQKNHGIESCIDNGDRTLCLQLK